MKKNIFKVLTRNKDQESLLAIRKEKFIPANLYGAKKDSIAIKINLKDFQKLYDQVGDTGLVYLQINEGKTQEPSLIDEIQSDPVTDQILHVAFKRVSLTEKINANIPIELLGEIDIPKAVLVTVKDHIEVEALPTDLPEKFELDVTQLSKIGDSLTFADLKYNQEKVSLVLGEDGLESPIVLIQEVKEEIEETPVAPAEAATAAEEGKETTEGGAIAGSGQEASQAAKPEKAEKAAEKKAEK